MLPKVEKLYLFPLPGEVSMALDAEGQRKGKV
jgi:hypothetical protein